MTKLCSVLLSLTLLVHLQGCDCNDNTAPGDIGVGDGVGEGMRDFGEPAVKHGTLGRFSALAASGGKLFASAYENNYGDLVVVSTSTGDLKTITKEVIDGVPAATPPQPGTYRGGIKAPGDDVGRDTDIFASPTGEILISYRDVTNRSLKVATRAADAWTIHTVQQPADGKEVVGRYTALVFVGGKPAVVYLVLNVDAGNGSFKSELRYAATTQQLPTGSGDWTITTIDSAPMPCQNLCESTDACVLAADGTSACAKTDTGCDPQCATTEACIGGTCKTIVPDVKHVDVPAVLGLWPCVVDVGGSPVVLYHDAVKGNLKGAARPGPAWNVAVVKGDDSDNVGAFCSATVDAGKVHATYQDAAKLSLNYIQLDPVTLKSTITEVIDDGVRGDGPHPVGADSAIIVDPAGKVRVVYQDAQNADLLGATRAGPNSWTPNDPQDKDLGRALLGGAKGYGFYTDLVQEGGAVYGSTFFFDQDATPKGSLEFFKLQ